MSASKAVIVDSNKDISGFRNVTIAGDLTVQGDTTQLLILLWKQKLLHKFTRLLSRF